MRVSHYYALAHVCIAVFLAQTPLANVARCHKTSEVYRNVSEATTHFELKLSERLLNATFDPNIELVGYLKLFEYILSSELDTMNSPFDGKSDVMFPTSLPALDSVESPAYVPALQSLQNS